MGGGRGVTEVVRVYAMSRTAEPWALAIPRTAKDLLREAQEEITHSCCGVRGIIPRKFLTFCLRSPAVTIQTAACRPI